MALRHSMLALAVLAGAVALLAAGAAQAAGPTPSRRPTRRSPASDNDRRHVTAAGIEGGQKPASAGDRRSTGTNRRARFRGRHGGAGTTAAATVSESVARMARFGVRSGSVAFANLGNGRFERTGARICHAEGRGFESLHPLEKGPGNRAFLLPGWSVAPWCCR